MFATILFIILIFYFALGAMASFLFCWMLLKSYKIKLDIQVFDDKNDKPKSKTKLTENK